jgi:small subunit ribosomal protein S16
LLQYDVEYFENGRKTMPVKIRLMRVGRKKVDQYRLVVADSRHPRDGRFLENIGFYHPQNEPSKIVIDEERALYWLDKGAVPTEKVHSLLKTHGVLAKFDESRKVKA